MDERLIAAAAAGDRRGDQGSARRRRRRRRPRRRRADRRPDGATIAGQTDAVEALIDAEANVDLQDDRLDNPFLYAGAEGLLDILRLANEAGADPALTNRFGGIALIPAQRAGPCRGRPLPADPDRCRHRPREPAGLDRPARGHPPGRRRAAHQAIVDLLIEHGADLDIADKDGVTPLAHARARGQTAIAAALEAAGATTVSWMTGRGGGLADDLEVGQARQHRLAADGRVLERDRDLLVAAGQLGGHHDAVAPAAMADAVAVAELALAGDDRARRRAGRASRPRWRRRPTQSDPDGAPAAKASRRAARSRLGRNVSPGRRGAGSAAALPVGRATAAAHRRPEAGRPPRAEDEVQVEVAVRLVAGRPAVARPSARPGSRAGTGTARPPGPSPRSPAARRATGTAAAWPG